MRTTSAVSRNWPKTKSAGSTLGLVAVGVWAVVPLAVAASGSPTTIPFTLEGHNIVVEVRFSPNRQLAFALDTGLSKGNVITQKAAKSLGIKADRDMGVHDASGERATAKLATLSSIQIGGVTLNDVPFAIIDIPGNVTWRPKGRSLAGFIGAPLMKDAVLCIDYRHRTLKHWPVADFDATEMSSVPMKLNHSLPTVEVVIDGRRATMIADSGAEAALTVYSSFAESNDFGRRYHPLGTETGNGGNGQTFQAVVTQAGTVAIGPGAEFSNVPLQVIPQGMDPDWGIDGMIGFQLLKELNPCLDRENERFLYKGE